ncbi:MAG: ABC transporter ATP-binding protein [Nitrososphaerales archaeon]
MTRIFECIHLTKIYKGSEKKALNGVSFRMPSEGILTLLGRNGAGKTTLLRIATTQLLPTEGSVSVLGLDVVKEAKKVRERISVLPQEGRPFPPLTPWDHVYYFLLARGLDRTEARTRAKTVLSELELDEYASTPADRLSGGLRQRILLAMALSTYAELIFLDEPTLGLDAVNQRKIWSIVRDYCKKYGSIVLTTHSLNEAETLSDYIVIINRGRVVAQGSVEELKAMMPYRFRIDVSSGFSKEVLSSYGKVVEVAGRMRVLLDETGAKDLALEAVKKRVSVSVSPTTLEDVFIDLVQEEGVQDEST